MTAWLLCATLVAQSALAWALVWVYRRRALEAEGRAVGAARTAELERTRIRAEEEARLATARARQVEDAHAATTAAAAGPAAATDFLRDSFRPR